MSIALILLLVSYFLILVFNYRYRKTFIDAFFFVMSPYVIIIFFNNAFMSYKGFYKISDHIIWLHLIAIFVFCLGTFLGEFFAKKYQFKILFRQYFLTDIKISSIKFIDIICIIIVMADILKRLKIFGIADFTSASEAVQRSIPAHISLLFVPLVVLLFDYFISTKDKTALVLVSISLLLIFSSFIKYHIIAALLSIYIYSVIRHPKIVKRLGVFTVGIIFAIFVLNYFLSFVARNVNVEAQFYFNHFWGYLVGGTANIEPASIYFNCNAKISISAWIYEMLTVFPGMLSQKLFGVTFTNYNFSTTVPTNNIGGGFYSNVVSILGGAYIQGGNISFFVFMFLWGALIQFIYIKGKKTKSIRNLTLASIFLAYNILSFFSSFFELSNPWETMILSFLIFPFLCIRISVRK